jgi:hypothetical protein
VQLDLRLIQADQVTTPDTTVLTGNFVDGIVFDDAGNPVEYHVLKQHPGDTMGRYVLEFDRVPAQSMLHWFRADRPGQARGIPDIMPALPLFAQLRRFTLAVIAAAETAADFAGILYTDAPAGGESEAAEPFEPIELDQRALVTMPGGWKMSQLQAEQPATTYAEFKKEILNEIARCLNMPFNVAAGNSSGHNHASGRLDHQTYFKSIRVDQAHLECVVLDRGLLEATLVVWLTDFGRTPKINSASGRDHWASEGSIVMAGAGIPGGAVLGRTDAEGGRPTHNEYRTEDIAATIYTKLGIPLDLITTTPDGRPIHLNDGRPIREWM